MKLRHGGVMPSREYYFFIEYLLRPDEEYDENGEYTEPVSWFIEVNAR